MKKYLNRVFKNGKYEFYHLISNALKNNDKQFIITANPEILMFGTYDNEMDDILLNKATYIVPDGIGVVKAIKYKFKQDCKKITGIDLTYYLLELANSKKYSCFFYGSKPEVLKDFVSVCKKKYPNIEIVGHCNGYSIDCEIVREKIVNSNADIILVALGAPKQEKEIAKLFDSVSKGVFVGVGGCFDVISGHVRRAPQFFITCNMEWLYRICTQPKRLKRFWLGNIKFIYRLIVENEDT